MGRRSWSGIVGASALVVFTACGGGDDAADDMSDAGGETMTPPAGTGDTTTPPGGAGVPPADLPAGVTQEMVTAGQALFAGVGGCFACHGQNGEGVAALGPNLTDDEWLNISGRNFEEIIQLVNTGVAQPKQFTASQMPPRGGTTITDEQVRQVAAYVATLGS